MGSTSNKRGTRRTQRLPDKDRLFRPSRRGQTVTPFLRRSHPWKVNRQPPTAVFIGRFQPFHIGHDDAFLHMRKKYARVKVLIGSSNVSRTPDNPLTFTERKHYLQRVLGKNVPILPLPDNESDVQWLSALRRHLRPVSVVHSGNDWVLDLCRSAGIPRERIMIRKRVSSTVVRRMIRQGDKEYLRFLAKPKLPANLLRTIRDTDT